MQAELYIETYKEPHGVPRVCGPDHKFNEQFEYDELAVKFDYEEETVTDDGAYLSGGEVYEYSHPVGIAQTFMGIKEVSSTQKSQFWIDAELFGALETEVQRQLDDGGIDPTPYEEGDEHYPY